jgi:hypothetical protein
VDHPDDSRAPTWQHDRPPVGVAACLLVCGPVGPPGWSAGRLAVGMSACQQAWQTACLCPSPDR